MSDIFTPGRMTLSEQFAALQAMSIEDIRAGRARDIFEAGCNDVAATKAAQEPSTVSPTPSDKLWHFEIHYLERRGEVVAFVRHETTVHRVVGLTRIDAYEQMDTVLCEAYRLDGALLWEHFGDCHDAHRLDCPFADVNLWNSIPSR